ncbi:redox-regulated ATPase YchF [Candidatus Roizmanbacteria bacterium]|nr:redox-regulated ATPase YchF [Candidatus Roizmanbacteria bacterium]
MAKLSIGIVGLPNVGKSTLFNAVLKKQVANVANYPFCTIEPNVGVIAVPDERLAVLAKIVKTEKIVPAVVEFYDIAGLVKGASQGEGLGNKFLSHIREVAAIVHVVRLFADANVVHVGSEIRPENDIQVIEAELMLADLATLEKQKEPRQSAAKTEHFNYKTAVKVRNDLNQGVPVRRQALTAEEKDAIRPLQLLTAKPVIYVFNVSEKQLEDKSATVNQIEAALTVTANGLQPPSQNQAASPPPTPRPGRDDYLYLNAKLESEITAFSPPEQQDYLKQYGLAETGLNRLIKKAYETLGLISFLTAGELEARAWTVARGTRAPQAAGTIHSDFEKKFIKADVIPFQEFVNANGWAKAREMGLVQIVGRDYVMKDGDVVEFKVGL